MSSILNILSECLPFLSSQSSIRLITPQPTNDKKALLSDDIIVNDILNILFDSFADDEAKSQIATIIGADGWKESIAARVLDGIQVAIEKGTPMGAAMASAYEKSTEAAWEFSKEHPFYMAIIAIGILAVMLPWALEPLGFAEIGIIEGIFSCHLLCVRWKKRPLLTSCW